MCWNPTRRTSSARTCRRAASDSRFARRPLAGVGVAGRVHAAWQCVVHRVLERRGAASAARSAVDGVDRRGVADADGPLRARVEQARVTPEQVRLVVDVDGIGTVDAVAPLGSRVSPGDEAGLRVDVTRLAVLPITPGS